MWTNYFQLFLERGFLSVKGAWQFDRASEPTLKNAEPVTHEFFLAKVSIPARTPNMASLKPGEPAEL
jgi:hypothetical protein